MEQNRCSSSLDAMDLKVEPECIFNEQVHVKEEVVECLKEEAEWEDSAADLASLYAGHEVKDELVLGPEGLQPRDIAFTLFATQALAVTAQPKLKDCVVRLERIDDLEAPLSTDTRRNKRRVENNVDEGKEMHSNSNIGDEKETYVCDICKKSFDLKTQLMEHVMIHIHQRAKQGEISVADNAGGGRGEGREPTRARGYRYSCEICKKKFPTASKLKRHERTHTGERPFACRICQQKFARSSHLKTHERTHTGKKPFSCGICQQKFAQSSNLKRHELGHTGGKPFSCGICKQKFAQSSTLKTHERTHTGVKPFSCGICQQKFAQSSALKTHERTHTGEKPFSCGICQQKFAYSSNLKSHARTHTGEKPFCCGICKRRFAHSSNLKKHERTHESTTIHMQRV